MAIHTSTYLDNSKKTPTNGDGWGKPHTSTVVTIANALWDGVGVIYNKDGKEIERLSLSPGEDVTLPTCEDGCTISFSLYDFRKFCKRFNVRVFER